MPSKMKKFTDRNKRLRKNKPDPESSSSESDDTIYETASETDSTYTPPKKQRNQSVL
jgi:hypothetical protein